MDDKDMCFGFSEHLTNFFFICSSKAINFLSYVCETDKEKNVCLDKIGIK